MSTVSPYDALLTQMNEVVTNLVSTHPHNVAEFETLHAHCAQMIHVGTAVRPGQPFRQPVYRIGEEVYAISLARREQDCGGLFEWIRHVQDNPEIWRSIGCVCHHLPGSET